MGTMADKQDEATAKSLGETKSVSAVPSKPIRHLDLFSGIGGFAYAIVRKQNLTLCRRFNYD